MFHNRNYNKMYILRKTPSVLFKQMKKENTNNNNNNACLSFCQYGCHLSVCDYRFRSSDVLYKLTFSSHNSQVKSACTQTHQPDTTHPYFTDQTPAPAFAHLNPEQIFYFSSAFVKCDSQGYTW